MKLNLSVGMELRSQLMSNKYLLFFGTSAFLKCLDSREEIQMKINQLIVSLFLILGFFGCGTSSANTPGPQNEIQSKQKLIL